MNEGCFKKIENGINRYFCSQCIPIQQQQSSTTTSSTKCEEDSEQAKKEIERVEHIEEVCECLVSVESTIKKTRSQILQKVRQQKLQQTHQLKVKEEEEEEEEGEICEVCQETNRNKAEIFCISDETKFCRNCFEKTHTLSYHKKHSTKTIQQWSKEIKQQQQKISSMNEQKGEEQENRECGCSIENIAQIFCITHEKICELVCVRCFSKEHNKCQIMGVESRAQEEKERLNITDFQNLLSKKIKGFADIENSLSEFLDLLENLKTQTSKKISQIKNSETQLRETKEYWNELDQKLGDKVWVEKGFVKNVETQIKKMKEKWERREKEEREGSRQQILKMKKEIEEFEEKFRSKEYYYFSNNNKVAVISQTYVPNKGTLITEGTHTWKVKIINVVPSTDVGVIKPEHNTHFGMGTPTAWGIRDNGTSCNGGSYTNAGFNLKDGDIITFNLDLSKKTLNYKINEKEVAITHTNVTSPVHIAFSGQIGASAQIIDYK